MKGISVRSFDAEVFEMQLELRVDEGQFIGRILGDAGRNYWSD